ncbi:MarR family winged helix-turn-helix transcriptional regulator [Gaopeijia maritima]|uniref:MarR family transcriptional regulator n=1 Tax=Gaopeijia maritima TaxID=3119007 RepID=A0ABU9E480_9BACT
MNPPLQDEIKQTRGFGSLEQEAFLGLGRTWALLEHSISEALKPHDITPTQYNVLRILRGAGDDGLCRGEIVDRMIAQVPDATRLLDRLQAADLIVRQRSEEDRRFVTTRITEAGLGLLDTLDGVVEALHATQFEGVDPNDLRTLIGLLDQVRKRG